MKNKHSDTNATNYIRMPRIIRIIRILFGSFGSVLIIAITLIPTFTLAQTPPEDTGRFLPLVTCGKNIDGKPETTLPGEQSCRICDVWVLADRAVLFVFYLAAPILIIVLIAGGFIYLTSGGNPKKTEQAKSLLTSAIVGIVIALAAFLIVDTILKTLVRQDFTWPSWKAVKTGDCPNPLEPEKVDLSKLPKPPLLTTSGIFTNEEEARSILGALPTNEIVNINKRPCTSIEDSGCTNVAGLPKSAVERLRQLQSYCSEQVSRCTFVVSGGTEYWLHSPNTNHRPGNPVVDIVPQNKTTSIFKSLRDAAKGVGGLSTVARCEEQGGTIRPLCDGETNHIHVEFPR